MAEAKRLCNEAMELARTFGPTDTCLSESIVRMADLYRWEGKHDLAEKTFKEAIASCEKAVGPNHPALVMPLDHLANFYYYTRIHLDRVVQLYQRMADIVEADPNADPTELAWRIRNVGTVYQQMGQYDEAVPKFKRAVELGEERDPDALPGYLLDMAGFYREWGKCDQAEPLAKRAVELREKKAAEPGAGIDPQLDMAFSFDALGGIYLAWDKPDQAEPVYSRAVAIIEKYSADGVDAPDLAPRLTGLAEALRRQGKHDQAEPLCKRALAITEKALGTDRPEVIPILEQYAKLLNDMNRPGEAKAVSDRIERIRKLLAAE